MISEVPLGRSCERGKDSLILGTPIHQLGGQAGQKELQGSEKSGEDILRQAEQRPKTQIDDLGHLTALPACDTYLMMHAGAGCAKTQASEVKL